MRASDQPSLEQNSIRHVLSASFCGTYLVPVSAESYERSSLRGGSYPATAISSGGRATRRPSLFKAFAALNRPPSRHMPWCRLAGDRLHRGVELGSWSRSGLRSSLSTPTSRNPPQCFRIHVERKGAVGATVHAVSNRKHSDPAGPRPRGACLGSRRR